MSALKLLPFLLISLSAQEIPNNSALQNVHLDLSYRDEITSSLSAPLRRHRLQRRVKKTSRTLRSSLTSLIDANELMRTLMNNATSNEKQITTDFNSIMVTTSIGACGSNSTITTFKIGDTLSVCISSSESYIIEALKNVQAASSGGESSNLVDFVGDPNLVTTIEGIDTSDVTLNTLVTLNYYYDSLSAGSEPPVLAINGTATINSEDIVFQVDVPFNVDVDLASLVGGTTTTATESAVTSVSSTTLCSCSPLQYNITLALDQNCTKDDLVSKPGIEFTLCLTDLGDSSSSYDPSAATITSITFIEFDTSGNLFVINQDDAYFNTSLINGDTVTFNSVSNNLTSNLSLDQQLELLPGGVQLDIKGVLEDGTSISDRLTWLFTNGCGVSEVTVESGDAIGWAQFEALSASSEFCPAVSSSVVDTTEVPVETTEAPVETTETPVDTTEASVVTTTLAIVTTVVPEEISMSISMSLSTSLSMSMSQPLLTSLSMGSDEVLSVPVDIEESMPSDAEESMSMLLDSEASFSSSMSASISSLSSMPMLGKSGKVPKTLKDAKPKASKADPKADKIASPKSSKIAKGENMSMDERKKRLFIKKKHSSD